MLGFKEYHSQLLQYLLTVFWAFDKLQTIALKAILELSVYCKCSFKAEDMHLLHQFLTQHYDALSLDHATILMQTIAQVMSVLTEGDNLESALG